MSVAAALAARLPARPLDGDGDTVRVELELADYCVEVEIRESSALEIRIPTAELPGVAIHLEPARRRAAGPRLELDDYDLECEPPELVDLWFDTPARKALTRALWAHRFGDGLGWAQGHSYDLGGGEVLVRGTGELVLERLERAVIAGAMLATRPQRIARSWLPVAHGLGGTTTAERWDLGAAFAVTIDRGAVPVQIDQVLRLSGEHGRHPLLRTRVHARRISPDDDRWALCEYFLEDAHRPQIGTGLARVRDLPAPIEDRWRAEATDPAALCDRLRPLTALLLAANPTVLSTTGEDIALWWPGMVMDAAVLRPAIELISRLAVDLGAATGPYR